MDFTLYRSDFAGVEANCRYPRQQKISCAEDLKAAAAYDHVCVAFKVGEFSLRRRPGHGL